MIVAEFAVPREFTFKPGEYVQIILPGELKHYFSVASSPSQQGIVRIATRSSQSEFKNKLRSMPLGTAIEIKGPWGDMLLPPDTSRPLVFIAGGIGITPFLSMLSYVTEENLPYEITLHYFNSSEALFGPELEGLVKANSRISISYISFTPSTSPFIPPQAWGGKFMRALFYLAGPPGFVNAALSALADLQIPTSQILHESYTGY